MNPDQEFVGPPGNKERSSCSSSSQEQSAFAVSIFSAIDEFIGSVHSSFKGVLQHSIASMLLDIKNISFLNTHLIDVCQCLLTS